MIAEKKTLLYVDDDADGCDLMRYWLRFPNLEFVATDSGESTLQQFKQGAFDACVLDYCLPDMTGADLCRRIREIDKQMPIIFYSAIARSIDRQKAIEAGATLYLTKPDDLNRLHTTIKKMVEEETRIQIPPRHHPLRRARSIV